MGICELQLRPKEPVANLLACLYQLDETSSLVLAGTPVARVRSLGGGLSSVSQSPSRGHDERIHSGSKLVLVEIGVDD